MTAQPQPLLDFDALVAMENASPIRHEYIGGRLYLMAGGTPNHGDIGHNLQIAVGIRLRGKPCRGTTNDQRVRTSLSATNWHYPDFLIKCPPSRFHPQDKNALLNPSAIFEVLSPDTEKFDRTKKFDEYALIKELTDYILISTEIARVEHFRRLENGGWELRVYTKLDEELQLDNFDVLVPLSEIYEDVEIAEQLVLTEFEIPA